MPRKTRMLLSTGEELDPRLLPRLGTLRNPDRRTLGAEVGEIARRLGQPLMPHQQYAADVALELDDDDELVYREVRLAWMRRAGKTNLIRSLGVHRCRVAAKRWGPQNVYYTAQSGLAARRKWEHDQVKPIDRSRAYGPLGRTKPAVRGRFGRVKLDNNDPGIFWNNGSIWRPAPPTETAGHGDDADLAIGDEAFAYLDDRVEQAYDPAMLTRRSPQFWAISAAGTDRSVYWYPKVVEGRRLDGSTDGPVCFLEYSAGEDEDPFDPATWWRRMPMLGFTVTEAAVAAVLAKARAGDELDDEELEEDAGDVGLERFLRPYLGIWCRVPTVGRQSRVISEAAWMANVDDTAEARYEAFGVHVTDDGRTAAIGWAGRCGDRSMIGVFDHRPGAGTGWLVEAVREIRARDSEVPIAVNPKSSMLPLVADLERAAGELVKTTGPEYAAACGALKIAVDESAKSGDDPVGKSICYRRQRALEDALAVASTRKLSGAWAWEFPPGADGTPLVAVTLALHAQSAAPTVMLTGSLMA